MIVMRRHFVVSSGKLYYERQRRDHLACFVAACYRRHDLEISAVLSGVLQSGGVEIHVVIHHCCQFI
jgi:hypothetical protein